MTNVTDVTTPMTGPEYFEQDGVLFEHLAHDVPACPQCTSIRAYLRAAAAQAREHRDLLVAVKQWKAECSLLTHKVLTCGVAADHPDANLAHTGAYIEKWDSPQAQAVRKLRARAESAESKLAEAQAEVAKLRQQLRDAIGPGILTMTTHKSAGSLGSKALPIDDGTDTGAPT